MKTNILNREAGVLKVDAKLTTNSTETLMYIDFPVDTLFDWYPLNTHYSYRYSEKNDLYYLAVETEGLNRPRYEVVDNKESVEKKKSHMEKSLLHGRPLWYNKQVQKHNMEVFDFAKRMGIKTPNDDYKQKDIADGFNAFHKALDALYDTALERFTLLNEKTSANSLDMSSKQEYNGDTFYEYKPKSVKPISGKDEEARAEIILAELNKDELDLYSILGEVYTMLTMMQKIINARR